MLEDQKLDTCNVVVLQEGLDSCEETCLFKCLSLQDNAENIIQCASPPAKFDAGCSISSKDTFLYVAGGCSNELRIYIYDIIQDLWYVSEEKLKNPRNLCVSAVTDELLLFVGGGVSYGKGKYLSSIEIFSL